LFFAIQVEVE
jgi:hypothetical protein